MKKTVLVLMLILTLLSMTSCLRAKPPESGTTPVVDVSQSGIRVGVILSGNEDSDNAYIRSHFQGIEAMRRALGLAEEQIEWVTDIPADDRDQVAAAIEACVDGGCKVIFGTERDYARAMSAAAKNNPEITFCNALVSDSSGPNNFSGYTVDMYEAQYLSGIVAAKRTKTGVIGFVGYPGDGAMTGINSFAMGVQRVNPAIRIVLRTVEERYDPAAESEAAFSLLDLGCDVIAQNTYSTAPQLAAAEREMWGTGFVIDMTTYAPKAHLQAPVVNWGIFYTKAVKETIEGIWGGYSAEEVDGEIQVSPESNDVTGGLADGLVVLSPVNHNCARGTTAAVNEAKNELFAGHFIFNGPIYDNLGNEICPMGEVLTEADEAESADWRNQNIIDWTGDMLPIPPILLDEPEIEM